MVTYRDVYKEDVNDDVEYQRVRKFVKRGIIVLVVLIILLGSFGVIDAGERGVKTRLGAVVSTVEPGPYLKLPFIEKIHKINIQTKTVQYEREDPLYSASKDLQDVKIAVVLNYRIDPTKVTTIYQQYGTVEQYEERIIRPAVRDTIKAVSSQFTAEELVTKRAEFTDKAVVVINERLANQFVTTERLNITNFEFSQSFTEAIERKVTAVQNAEAAKNKLEQIKFEAQQTIETAKAQAEAIRIQAQAINSQGGADYVMLEALKRWDGHGCTTQCFGAGTQMPVPFFNLNR